ICVRRRTSSAAPCALLTGNVTTARGCLRPCPLRGARAVRKSTIWLVPVRRLHHGPPPFGSLPLYKSTSGSRYRRMGGSRHQRGRSPHATALAADHSVTQDSASISSAPPNRGAPARRARCPSAQANTVPPRRILDHLR